MAQRQKLHDQLVAISGVAKVYFQPPANLSMVYPCIRYKKSREDREHADNKTYRKMDAYEVTVIDRDPDSAIAEAVSNFMYCSFSRAYAEDSLNHFVYTVYS